MYNKTNDMKGRIKMDNFSEILLSIFSVLLILVFAWFTFTIANIFVTIRKCKKLDNSLKFCFNTSGKVVYSLLFVLYIVGTIGGIAAVVYGLMNDNMNFYRNGINLAAFVSVVFGYMLSSIVLVGRKNMMVGRMMIDYRKLKKVNYTYQNKMSFVYAQHDYNFSTRFVDKTQLRKIISK